MKDKAFFFFNYEERRAPSSSTLQRTVLSPDAVNGIFSYNVAGAVRQVNLLQLAAANGQLATPDPVTAKVLNDIRAATRQSGGVTPPEQSARSAVHVVDADEELSIRRRPSASTTRSRRTIG